MPVVRQVVLIDRVHDRLVPARADTENMDCAPTGWPQSPRIVVNRGILGKNTKRIRIQRVEMAAFNPLDSEAAWARCGGTCLPRRGNFPGAGI